MIMKKPKKIPFGVILAFVFTSCSTKAKQIWPFNFLEWPNSLSFYCTYFLCWVTFLYMRRKVYDQVNFEGVFFNLFYYLSSLCLWGWDWQHLSETMPGESTFYLMGTFEKSPWSALKYSMSFPCGGPLWTIDSSPEVSYYPFLPASQGTATW